MTDPIVDRQRISVRFSIYPQSIRLEEKNQSRAKDWNFQSYELRVERKKNDWAWKKKNEWKKGRQKEWRQEKKKERNKRKKEWREECIFVFLFLPGGGGALPYWRWRGRAAEQAMIFTVIHIDTGY